jgi:hypothetical protein
VLLSYPTSNVMSPDRGVLCAAAAFALVTVLTDGVARGADPTTSECLAANEMSIELRNQHKLHAARAQLLACSAVSCPADVRDECVRRVAEVNAAIPTIIFVAKDGLGNDVVAVKVTMDGQPLVDRLEGTGLSIDPGEHSFAFETAGQPRVEKRFVIHEGEKDRRERILLGVPPSAAGEPKPAAVSSGAAPATPSGDSSKRVVGYVVGGVGVVGVGAGVTLVALGVSLASRGYNEDQTKSGSGHNDYQSGLDERMAGFVVGGVGVAALGVAAYLVLSSWDSGPSGSAHASSSVASGVHLAPVLGPQQAGLG